MCNKILSVEEPCLVSKYIDMPEGLPSFNDQSLAKRPMHIGKLEVYAIIDIYKLPKEQRDKLLSEVKKWTIRRWRDHVNYLSQHGQDHIEFSTWLEYELKDTVTS
jgi:hypothetical protein